MRKCPECGSENIEKEFINGHRTGDLVCRKCGNAGMPNEFEVPDVREPPKGERVYDAWIQIENFRELFDKRLQEFMDRNGLILDIYETNPQYAIRSAFEHWSMSQKASDYKSPWEAFDVFFEKNKDNSIYFSKNKVIKSLTLIRQIEDMLEHEGKTELYKAVQNIVASDGADGATLAYPDESMVGENRIHAAIILNHWNEFESYAHKTGLLNLARLQNDLARVTGIALQDNIVKRACKELGVTQKELAEKLGITPSAISQWGNDVPKTTQVAIELMIENNQLKKDIKVILEGHAVLNRLAVQNLDT